MVDVFYAIASIGFLFWITRNAFFWGNLLQRNAYSITRTKDFLMRSSPGRHILFSPLSLIKWFAILLYPVIIFYEAYASLYHVFIGSIYLVEIVQVLKETVDGSFSRRHVSLKTFFIISLTVTLGVILFIIPPLDKFLWLVIIDRFIIFSMFLLVMVPVLPEELYWEYRTFEAMQKRKKLRHLKPILILGGTEATIVVTLLKDYLSQKDPLLIAPEPSEKQEIVRSIHEQLKPSHQYFIIAPHDTSLKNIKELVTLMNPRYSILMRGNTALLQAGSENEKSYVLGEMTSVLPKQSILYLDALCAPVDIRTSIKKHIRVFGRGDYIMRDVRVMKRHTTFTVSIKQKVRIFRTTLVTHDAAYSILPFIALLTDMGVSYQTVKTLIERGPAVSGFLEYTEKDAISLLNNARVSEPERLLAISSYLSLFKKKKLLVWAPGVIIGAHAAENYRQAVDFVAEQFDYIFLLNSQGKKDILTALKKRQKASPVIITTEKRCSAYLHEVAKRGDIIVFIGEESAYVYSQFITMERYSGL